LVTPRYHGSQKPMQIGEGLHRGTRRVSQRQACAVHRVGHPRWNRNGSPVRSDAVIVSHPTMWLRPAYSQALTAPRVPAVVECDKALFASSM
jgi:hypothetical protein